jgi:hypothetical protein
MLGRARYERRPERQRGLRNYESGLRNGFRPRHVQTAEGELRIEIPQVRDAAMPFVSKLFFSHASNGATFTDVDRQHLHRTQGDPATLDEEVTAA